MSEKKVFIYDGAQADVHWDGSCAFTSENAVAPATSSSSVVGSPGASPTR